MGRVAVTTLSVLWCFSLYCSLIVFICSHIPTIIIQVLFSSLIFPVMNFQSFFTLWYTPIPIFSFYIYGTLLSPFVCQAICLTVLFFLLSVLLEFIFRYCYSLLSHTVVAFITLSTTSHALLLLCTHLCNRYFIR